MKIMNWRLSGLIPTSPPLRFLGLRSLIWKTYAYFVAAGLLTLITGGIGLLYLFEVVYRLNLSFRQRNFEIKKNSSSLSKVRA